MRLPRSSRGRRNNDDVTPELIAATALTALAASRGWSQALQPGPAPPASTRTPLRTRFAGQLTGDFDAMLDRRLIRLVVPYSPTLFFEDKGEGSPCSDLARGTCACRRRHSTSYKSREHNAARAKVERPTKRDYAGFVDSEANSARRAFGRSGGPTQRCRRRFFEERAVGNRKATQFPEPVIGGHLGYSRPFRVRTPQCPARQIHSTQPEIPLRAHAEVLEATVTQGPIGRSDLRGEFRHV